MKIKLGLYFFFFSFHLLHTFWGKKDCLQGWPRTTVRLSFPFLFIYFTRFGGKRTVYKGDHVQCRVTRHPPIDRLLLTRSLSLFLFLFIFLFFSFISHILGKKDCLQTVCQNIVIWFYFCIYLYSPPICHIYSDSEIIFLFGEGNWCAHSVRRARAPTSFIINDKVAQKFNNVFIKSTQTQH
jgi:hypothetical protein